MIIISDIFNAYCSLKVKRVIRRLTLCSIRSALFQMFQSSTQPNLLKMIKAENTSKMFTIVLPYFSFTILKILNNCLPFPFSQTGTPICYPMSCCFQMNAQGIRFRPSNYSGFKELYCIQSSCCEFKLKYFEAKLRNSGFDNRKEQHKSSSNDLVMARYKECGVLKWSLIKY